MEASAVKQLLEESIGVEDGDEVNLLQTGHPPIMIRGEDGVLYQVGNTPFQENRILVEE